MRFASSFFYDQIHFVYFWKNSSTFKLLRGKYNESYRTFNIKTGFDVLEYKYHLREHLMMTVKVKLKSAGLNHRDLFI